MSSLWHSFLNVKENKRKVSDDVAQTQNKKQGYGQPQPQQPQPQPQPQQQQQQQQQPQQQPQRAGGEAAVKPAPLCVVCQKLATCMCRCASHTYCSRDCQLAAWDAPLNHKASCKMKPTPAPADTAAGAAADAAASSASGTAAASAKKGRWHECKCGVCGFFPKATPHDCEAVKAVKKDQAPASSWWSTAAGSFVAYTDRYAEGSRGQYKCRECGFFPKTTEHDCEAVKKDPTHTAVGPEADRAANGKKGLGKISNWQVQNQCALNDAAGFGSVTNMQLNATQRAAKKAAGYSYAGVAQHAAEEAERAANGKKGLGKISNWQVQNQCALNDAAGFGSVTNVQLTAATKAVKKDPTHTKIRVEAERAANGKKGLGKISNWTVQNQCALNDAAGFGSVTNMQLNATQRAAKKAAGYSDADAAAAEKAKLARAVDRLHRSQDRVRSTPDVPLAQQLVETAAGVKSLVDQIKIFHGEGANIKT